MHKNKSLICLPMKTKGVQVVKKLDKLGMRSSDTAQIFFDEVKVPVRNTIGQEGMGFVYQMQQFQEERLWGAICAVVGMERLIDQTVEYTRERKVFGRPLLDNQVIHFKLAELRTEVELVRSLCYRACEEYLEGTDVTMLASMAKLKAGRMMRVVTDGCLQYWGGAGYLWESPTARAFRDSRLASIGGGADEVMLQIISKLMGTLPSARQPLSAGVPMADFAQKYQTLLLHRERSRLHVTLNRPEVKNALNPTLIGELRSVFEILRERRDIKVVILRGAGGTFCAGADLKNMEQSFADKPKPGEKDPIALNNREFGTFLEMVNTSPQVVVAAVEGYAIAGGFGILCVSDVAICTEEAGFAMSETALGIVPAQIAPFVAARIGVPQTRHLTLTAARFKGPEAYRLGIAHYLVKDSAALDAKLEELLKQIDRCAPVANALTKQVVMKVGSEPLSSVLDFAADKFAEARRGPEAAEGLRAFAEKRPPRWAVE